ncbi:phospholipid phosphatase-related protein type 4 [Aplochiton taeniatus]
MSAKERLKGSGGRSKDSVTLLPCFYFVELPILASSVVSLYFLELTDVFEPVHSGYSCSDRSLSLPYVLPRQEVCPLLLLFSLAFAGPAVTILVGEAILYCCSARRSSVLKTEGSINAAGCSFNSYIRRAVRFVGVHVFGLCVTALITDILQLSTGAHTPYWLEVCKPNLTQLNLSCDDSFILEDICSGHDLSLITAGRKSFPSQHATLAAFAAVYISMYFNAVLTESSKLLKPLLVFSFIMVAVMAGLTRIIQFRNHPVDIYCGWLLGGAIALYLGVYAVGNFKPTEDRSRQQQPPLVSLPSLNQSQANSSHHNLPPSQPEPIMTRSSSHILAPSQQEPILTRSSSYRDTSLSNLKRASAEVEVISPPSPLGNQDSLLTFSSSTLPRSHGGSSLEEGRVPRRHASIHASMDSQRSKLLLSQWKSKNENRKLSLQVMDSGVKPTPLPAPSPQRTMELRCSSEPSAMGLEAELRAGAHIPAQYMKLAASSIPLTNQNHLPHNGSSGLAGGARVSIQSRPGSSQLVHIPEEDNGPTTRDPESESEESYVERGGSVRAKWLKVSEKSAPVRPLSAGGQPRIMQVIALSKQQGMLHSPRGSEDGSTVSCTGSIRYRALPDLDPSPPASTSGADRGGGGLERSGSIVRVDAHPESRPVVKPPSTDGSGSWRWKPPEQRSSLRQSAFELNDLNRQTDSDGYVSGAGRRSVGGAEPGSEAGSFYPLHTQPITTIRVTPVEAEPVSEAGSDSQSVASSRESTLRRQNNIIILPDNPHHDNADRYHDNIVRHHDNTVWHHDNGNRHPQYYNRASPTPPPTLPHSHTLSHTHSHTPPPTLPHTRTLSHTPPPAMTPSLTHGLAWRE